MNFTFSRNKTAFIIFIVIFGITALFSLIGVDAHHDGIMLKPAIDVSQGKTLFKESFSIYGAASILLQAAAIKVFGEYLAVIRILTALFYALIAVLLYLIWSRLLPKWLSILSCFIWFFLSHFFIYHYSIILFPWSTVYATFTVVLTIYLLFLYIEQDRILYWFLIGLTVSLTFWFKLNYGITAFCSILFYLILQAVLKKQGIECIKRSFIFLAGFLSVFSVFIVWIYSNDALNDFWLQSVTFATAFAKSNFYNSKPEFFMVTILKRMFLLGIKDQFTTYIWIAFPIATVWLYLRTLVNFSRSKKMDSRDEYILSLAVLAIFNWVNYYPISAIFQLHISAAPMIGLFTLFIYEASSSCLVNLHLVKYLRELRNVKMFSNFIADSKKVLSYFIFNSNSNLFSGNTSPAVIIVLVILALSLGYDLHFRIIHGLRNIRKSDHHISSIKSLSGMRVKKDYSDLYNEIGDEVNKHLTKYPNSNIISLTGNALFTTFNKNNKNFSPMYLYWTWMNTYLYPDYMTKLRNELANNQDLIFSDYFMIDGYVPKKCYLIEGSFQEPFVLMSPGKKEDIFSIEKSIHTRDNLDYFSFKITTSVKQEIEINSIIIIIINNELIPKKLNPFEFEHKLLPTVLDSKDKDFLIKTYIKDDAKEEYVLDKTTDKSTFSKLRVIFVNLFLNNNYLGRWNTLENSLYSYISIKFNDEVWIDTEKSANLKLPLKKGDRIKLILPYIQKIRYGKETSRIRINYNDNKYSEYIITY